jgi:thiamine-phosphate pyrophosphorylase
MRYFQYHMISDRRLLKCTLAEAASEADKQGVDYFQLREKDLSPRELFDLAREIRPLLKQTRFIINGSLDVALACKADGVHLQRYNIPVTAVREKYKNLRIGYSAHSFTEMKGAEEQGADYVFISPIFGPLSKGVGAAPPLGTDIVADWTKSLTIPVFALGGISAANMNQLGDSGCTGIAGIRLFLSEGCFSPEGMVM